MGGPRSWPPSCGPPVTAASTRGCRCRCWAGTARSSSAGASRRSKACTWWGSGSSTAATPTSSTACATTPPSSPATSPAAALRCAPPARLPAEPEKGPDMLPRSSHDVVVVGGRAAGAATAMLLARAGLDVLVVERGRYGTDTLSTQAPVRRGVRQRARWGLLAAIGAAGAPPVRAATFPYAGDAMRVPVKPVGGVDALYAPRRTVLDPVLVDAARAAGAVVEYGTSVTSLTRDEGGRVVGVEGRDLMGRPVRHEARWVVGADGFRSTVAAAVNAPTERWGTAATAAVYGYWPGLEDDGYQWIFRSEGCAGLIPTNDGLTCVFVLSTPARIGRGGITVLRDIARR